MRTLRGTVVVAAAGVLLAGCSGHSSGTAGGQRLTADQQYEKARAHDEAQARHDARVEARIRARTARRVAREQARAARQPRKVYYLIRGSAVNATVTYTATGGGTTQRDIGVVSEWRSATVRLRPGAFAYVSVQNSGASGTVTCKITEDTVSGSRVIAPATSSSGGYAIADCNGSVK